MEPEPALALAPAAAFAARSDSRTAPATPHARPAWAAEPEPVAGPASRTAPLAGRAHPAWAAAEPELAGVARAAHSAPASVSRPDPARAAEPGAAASHGSAVAVAAPRPDSGAALDVPREHPAEVGASGSFGPAAAAAVAVAAPCADSRTASDAPRTHPAWGAESELAAPAPAPASAALGAPREEAGASAPAETSFGRVAAPVVRSAQADEPVPPHGWEVPAARAESESEPVAAAAAPEIPHPQDSEAQAGVDTLSLRTVEPEPEPEFGPADPPGVPGPGVAEIVAQAVARGVEGEEARELPGLPPRRGTSVTEVPVHLPFRGEPKPMPAPATRPGRSQAAPRPAPGRRVPRGDDRLREHRGPVLPGWVGVAVGGIALAGCTAVLWRAGAVPAPFVAAFGATPRAYQGLRATHWPPLAFLGIVALVALGGLGRARTGHAWVLTLFGRYRGTVRRTGLTWVSPLLLRRRVDVRLRHWRSDPMPAVDSGGLALQVVVQVVWQVKDTARATLAVENHTEYLAEQVESAMARVLSQLPADAFHEDAPTLRDAEAVGDALTRMVAAETEAVGIEVFSAQPTRIEYAAEVAEAMRRRRVAAIDAKHRDTVLTSVVDAVDDTVHRLTSRGLVELDDYERKALVKDLTVAFYTGRPE
ncbi:SPFH domain-containing protein [Streptomyces sp. 147326]|uniref:SPFH domain-containing protein n=1 Tax=Streptomyces sp. 147326 TaxID=3074379 RepID=UPI0038573284